MGADMRSNENNLGCIWYVIAGIVMLAVAVYSAVEGLFA